MTDELDKKIREALSKEDAELFDSFGEEPGLIGLTMETLSGRFRLINSMAFVVMFAMMIGMVYCFFEFYQTDSADIKALIGWGIGGSLLFLSVSVMKIWFWMLINRNDTVREVKRLELRLSALVNSIENAGK